MAQHTHSRGAARTTLGMICLAGLLTAGAAAAEKPVVYTTFYPTTYFAERIAGDLATIECPCPPDADPAMWMPDDKTIEAYQQADLIVVNGASFEHWLPKVMLPESRIVDTTRPLRSTLIKLERGMTHSHGPGGAHVHHGTDGHTWVDPENARIQAREILKALGRKLPDKKAQLQSNFDSFVKDLEALDARLKAVSKKIGDQQLVSNHPTYNYLARHYGWNMKVFYIEPDGETEADELKRLSEFLAEHPAKYLFWESEPSEEIAKKMAAKFNLESVIYEPAETLDAEQKKAGTNYLSIMNANVDRLEQVFGQEQ